MACQGRTAGPSTRCASRGFRKEIFIEATFERRFQAILRSAWQKQSWHVIVADPGSGKTMGIRDLIRTAGSPEILAVTAPKNNEEVQALGNQLFSDLFHERNGKAFRT